MRLFSLYNIVARLWWLQYMAETCRRAKTEPCAAVGNGTSVYDNGISSIV